MCDLLGLTFNTEIMSKISLNLFQERGLTNPDGWGLAYYNKNRLQIIKEARSSVNSSLYDFMESWIHSKIIISHVRRSTRGAPSYFNTHPFYRQLNRDGVKYEYAFAHNGTLTDVISLQSKRFLPIGETDSEKAFCYLLDVLSSRETLQWGTKDFQFLESVLREINDGQNTLNCIFSDGVHLFCYSDENNHNNGLRFVRKEYPFGKVELASKAKTLGFVDITSEKELLHQESYQSGYIISTRILTKELWTEFHEGELIVFEEGRMVYPDNRI